MSDEITEEEQELIDNQNRHEKEMLISGLITPKKYYQLQQLDKLKALRKFTDKEMLISGLITPRKYYQLQQLDKLKALRKFTEK